MSTNKTHRRAVGYLGLALMMAMGGFFTVANAAIVEITASFSPDPSKPFENRFRNTTNNRGLCAAYPAYCAGLNIQSLMLPIIFSAKEPIRAGHSQRNGPMIKLPGWSDLQVTHNDTGATEVLRVRIKGIGGSYHLGQTVHSLTGIAGRWGHRRLWGSTWGESADPCTAVRYMDVFTEVGANFFWIFPEEETVCAKQSNFDLDKGLRIDYANQGAIMFAYELETPNPLKMDTGTYTGQVTYTVGPGQDIDFGDVMLPNDSVFQINFTLTVEHTLKVEIPPGGNRIQLEPQGGWQAWLNQGRKPAKLFRDQTFNLSASSRFKMQLACGTGQIGDTCAMQNAAGDQVPLDVLVSLPNGLTNPDGGAVNRLPLKVSGAGTELFQPSFYVDRRPGTLHFEVQREGVEEMLEREGDIWSGTVSVIWDSEVG